MPGRTKKITTQEKANEFSTILEVEARIDDLFCQTWRLRKPVEDAREPEEGFEESPREEFEDSPEGELQDLPQEVSSREKNKARFA